MAAAGRWFVTPHAIRRYIERVDPKATEAQALGRILHEVEGAHLVRVDDDGVEHWRGLRPRRLRFRVQPSTDPGQLPQLVTVLAGCEAARRDRPRRQRGPERSTR